MSYKYAVIFPGQGSQHEGLSHDIINLELEVTNYFTKLESIVNKNKAKLVIEAKKDDISRTAIAQLAIFLNSISLYKLFVEKYSNIKIGATAGLSLGEYSSHFASGSINFEDAVKLIDIRGDIMTKYASGKGTMLAVMKSSIEDVENIISTSKLSKNGTLSICNLNCPGQIVVGGDYEMIEIFKKECHANGLKKLIELDVEGPFHTEILKDASEEFYNYLSKCNFNDFSFDVYTNLTGNKYESVSSIPITLKEQMYSQVKFEYIIRNMIKDGYNRFIEIGPGNTLKGFIKKIDKNVEVFNIQYVEDILNGGLDEL